MDTLTSELTFHHLVSTMEIICHGKPQNLTKQFNHVEFTNFSPENCCP